MAVFQVCFLKITGTHIYYYNLFFFIGIFFCIFSLDYGKLGIRFNCVSPGYIKTDMTGESWTNLEKRKSRQSRTTLDRWGTPEDLVGIVFLLCSDGSSYITGQDFLIDGGWSIKGL